MKPGRNAGAIERVFEHAQVGLRRAQKHRHLVEWRALGRLRQQATGNFDRFSTLAGRREQNDRLVGRAGGGRFVSEQVPLQSVQSVIANQRGASCVEAEFLLRPPVAGRQRHDDRHRCGDRRTNEHRFGFRVDRDVQQYDGGRGEKLRVRGQLSGCRLEHRGVIYRAGLLALGDRTLQQLGQVVVAWVAGEPVRLDSGHSQFAERAAERARKAGHHPDRGEVFQLIAGQQVVGYARGDGLVAERCARRQAPLRQGRDGQLRHQFGQAHSRHAKRGAAVSRECKRELVGRAAAGGHD